MTSGLRDGFVLHADRQNLQWVAELAPGVESALERPDTFHTFVSEEQRHTGAGGFVWSSTVKNDLAIARQPFIGLLEFAGIHAKRAGNRFRVGFEVHGVP